MKMTEDARRRCSSLLNDFATRNHLRVNIDHEIGEGQTKICFETPNRSMVRQYWMDWSQMNSISEGCAYIFADLIQAWNLDSKTKDTAADSTIGYMLHSTVENWLDTRFKIKNVIFNDPATIVLWEDGTKTVVKCQDGDIYSRETGLALCIAKKAFGNKGNFNEVFKKWIPEEEKYTIYTNREITNEITRRNDPLRHLRDTLTDVIYQAMDAYKKEKSE